MLNEILLAITMGLAVCMPFGPINLLILNYSAKALPIALCIGFGAAFCDSCLMLVFAALSASVPSAAQDWLGIFGALILLYMAASLLRPPREKARAAQLNVGAAAYALSFAKGFLLNALNPYVVVFWMGTGAQIASREHPVVYGFSLALTCFAWVVALALVVSHFARFLSEKILRAINIFSGLALMFFALKLALSTRFFA